MDSKYFTPSLEDIHYGYEYEENAASLYNEQPSETWYPRVFKEPFSQGYNIGSGIKKHRIRVPYLTKEQIEAEGWKNAGGSGIVDQSGKETITGFYGRKGNYEARFDIQKHSAIIETLPSYYEGIHFAPKVKFEGKCKDINTFRYICRLLGI